MNVAIDLHFVQERVEDKIVLVNHISSKLQRTDIFTKALSLNLYLELQSNLVDNCQQT